MLDLILSQGAQECRSASQEGVYEVEAVSQSGYSHQPYACFTRSVTAHAVHLCLFLYLPSANILHHYQKEKYYSQVVVML